jgi:hypothetical protein
LNQNRDADKLSVGVDGFVVEGWFVIKLWGFVMFVAEKNRGRIRNKRGREEGHLSGHKSNITDGFNQHI